MSVTIVLSGGLGNQMFQYAAAKALAQRLGTYLIIDLRYYMNSKEHAKLFRLNEFAISDRVLTYGNGFFQSPHRWPRRLWGQIGGERYRTYTENCLGYHPSFKHLSDGVVLKGYFQSPLYFKGMEDIILDSLRPIDEKILSEWPTVALRNCINIHVRRGDYLDKSNFVLSDALVYYARALEAAKNTYPDSIVHVYSDDLNWCAQQKIFRHAVFKSSQIDASPLLDLARMANCKALIISNSTYSWWAAFIGARYGCDIYAPSRWILNLDAESLKIYPEYFRIVQ